MNGRKYIMQQKLKKDTEIFNKKLNLSKNIDFFTTQIKNFSEQITDYKTKKYISSKHEENTEDLLKYYFAELNLKIFPDSYKKNYGNENIMTNLSNLKLISNLQEMKKNMLNNDKKNLEDNSKDIVYYLEQMRKIQIKKQLKQDIYRLELYEIKRKEYEEISEIIPQLLNNVEKFKIFLRKNKFLYEQILKQNKILEKILQKQKDIYNKLKQEEVIFEKNNGKKKIKIDIDDIYNNKKLIRNIRSLSEENLQFINYQSENYYEKNFGEKENKKPKSIHSLLFDNPKFIGYKSPMSFLKHNKMITKKLLKKYKPINPYNYLNIFSNNKKFDSIGEFIENFNFINNKKISFYTLNSDKTTTTKFKTNTISSNISSKKKKQKHRLFSSKLNDEDNHNTIISLRDFLIDLIEQQKRLIKEIENKKAEEIRSHNQIKTFISDYSTADVRSYASDFCNMVKESSGNTEQFLFYTDPHLAAQNGRYQTEIMLDRVYDDINFIEKAYNSAPLSFFLCGGDWLGNSDTKSQAAEKLAYIDGFMRKKIKNYVPIIGNHDTNYQGYASADSSTRDGRIGDTVLKNFWQKYREERRAYYLYKAPTCNIYIFDTGTENEALGSYQNEQLTWFANSLMEDESLHIVIAMHIFYPNTISSGVIQPLTDKALLIAQAYNARTSIEVNGQMYNFNIAGRENKVSFCIAGHTHRDTSGVLHDIPFIVAMDGTAQGAAEEGWSTDRLCTFDMCLVDWDEKKLRTKRVGYGDDRTITVL